MQQLLTDWSMGSYGLHALVGYGDLTRIQMDRFDDSGGKWKSKLTRSNKFCLGASWAGLHPSHSGGFVMASW